MPQLYAEDSFFTLGMTGRIGLLALSLALALVTLYLCRHLPGPRLLRLGLALVVFGLFVWLSPQIYYQYYRIIILGLPQQWVVGTPIPLGEALQYLSFQGPATFSAHSQGVLGWLCMILAGLKRREG